MREITQAIEDVVQQLFKADEAIELTRPDEQFGDYSTNVALQLGKKLGKNPREVAESIAAHVRGRTSHIEGISVAGPGFLNLKLTDKALIKLANSESSKPLAGQVVVVELSSPNPFKEFHIGHMYNNTVGEALARLHEQAGATVHRVSYHGDVGMHIAMSIWAIKRRISDDTSKLTDVEAEARPLFLGEAYAEGATAFKEDEEAQQAIKQLNKQLYDRSDEVANTIYDECRTWSLNYFNNIYKLTGAQVDKAYFESQSGPKGLEVVKTHLTDRIFEESDGAIIYRGEKVGLHTRVFVNAQGLPTYEAKDIGLTMLKWQDFKFDRSVIITANEIDQYFKVVLAAMHEVDAKMAERTVHLSHGLLKLTTGKMSSRTGQVLRALDVIDMVRKAAKSAAKDSTEAIEESTLGAIKYAFLKQRISGDTVFDIEESVATEGNSGPYLQYAHARARSILAKARVEDQSVDTFEPGERSLLRKLGEYAETVDKAVNELMPHHIATYLYELAQNFNSFYEHNRVIGDPRQAVRLQLVQAYADTLKNGLTLLNIPAPDHM